MWIMGHTLIIILPSGWMGRYGIHDIGLKQELLKPYQQY